MCALRVRAPSTGECSATRIPRSERCDVLDARRHTTTRLEQLDAWPFLSSCKQDLLMVPESSNLAVLGLGFILGLKHATDADHIVAVSTFVGRERQLRRACAIGLLWGAGHTLALTIAGLIVLILRIPISKWLADRL